MNAKEKAVELIKKFIPFANSPDGETNWINANQCAIIAVKEIIKAIPVSVPAAGYGNAMFVNPDVKYYQEVLTELERM